MGELQLYFWLGLLLGLAATIFAGPLARLLTFVSEPSGKRQDLSDQLLGQQGADSGKLNGDRAWGQRRRWLQPMFELFSKMA